VSLKHALLGFLNYGPHTGYELKKVFDISVSHFWSAELSQIYPSLKALESEGLVEMKVEVQADRPNRKVYSITDDGRRELIDWLATPAGRDQVREPLLVKIFFAAAASRDQLLGVLRQRAAELRYTLEGYEAALTLADSYSRAAKLEREGLFWCLTIEYEISHTHAILEWIETAISTVQAVEAAAFGPAPVGAPAMDTRQRVDILDSLKNRVPGAYILSHGGHPGETDS
jgi:DNA-binding PadR family transcriptional regulator